MLLENGASCLEQHRQHPHCSTAEGKSPRANRVPPCYKLHECWSRMAAGREEKQQHDLLGGVGEAPCQQSRQTVGPCRSLCSSSVLKVEGHFDFKWLSVIVSSDTNGSQSGTGPHVAFCWLAQRPGEAPGAPQGSDPTGVSVSPGVGSAVLSKCNSGHSEWEGSGVSQQGKAPGKPFSPAAVLSSDRSLSQAACSRAQRMHGPAEGGPARGQGWLNPNRNQPQQLKLGLIFPRNSVSPPGL